MKEPPSEPCERSISEEEFYRTQGKDSPYELLGGALVVCEPVSHLHADLAGWLLAMLRIVFEEHGGGKVQGPQYPMRLDPEWSPEPDVMVVRQERLHKLGPQRLDGVADLVIEIASPGDIRRALRLKLPRYRQARVPEIWVIDPYAGSVHVEVLQSDVPGTQETQEDRDTLKMPAYQSRLARAGRQRSAAFPWLWIDVSWLWQTPLPPVLGCVRQILG